MRYPVGVKQWVCEVGSPVLDRQLVVYVSVSVPMLDKATGTVPVKKFDPKFRVVIWVRVLPKKAGIVPCNTLVSTRKESSWVSADIVAGRVPVKELLYRPSDVNFVNAEPM